jgi:hypothetical protein
MAEVLGIDGLVAHGPSRRYANKLKLFGQFVGDWEIVSTRGRAPKGVRFSSGGEVHFGWVLGGMAVQDVWMTYNTKTRKTVPVGTTIRVYDPKIGAWLCTWVSVIRRTVRTSLAKKVGADIVILFEEPNVDPERWVFSDITPNSFRWHSEESHDKGKTWVITEEMKMNRRIFTHYELHWNQP